MTRIRPLAAFALALVLAPCAGAYAQSLDGIKVGEAIKTALLDHPPPSLTGKIGTFDGYRWNLPTGNELSVTADPDSGRIVYVEIDWGGGTAPDKSDVPGLVFGKSTLGAIHRKYGSSGFNFKAHAMKMIGPNIISVTGYELAHLPKTVLMLVTGLPVKDVPEVGGKPAIDPDKGTLQALILADIDYLSSIWGQERVADPKSHPVEWK